MPEAAVPAFPELCVVLVRTQGPVNLGLCARACSNLGVADLRLVAPLCTVDCPEARKFANHVRDRLLAAPVFPDLDAALADCGLAIGTTARPRQGQYGPPIGPEALPGVLADRPCARVALVFGNEADGLSTPELDRCQIALRLATPGDYSSYNVSHALAITLYLLRAALPPPGTTLAAPAAAPREQVERLLHYWLDTLERIHYFRRTSKERWSLRFRRLINRLPLSPDDVSVFMGMLAQVNHFAARAKAGPAGADPPPGGTLH